MIIQASRVATFATYLILSSLSLTTRRLMTRDRRVDMGTGVFFELLVDVTLLSGIVS